MEKAILMVCLIVFAAVMTGSATPHDYCVNRGRDAADMFTATVGIGAGAKGRVGPVNLGAFGNLDWGGLRGGQYKNSFLFDLSPCDLTLTVMSFETFLPYLDISKERHKFFVSRGYAGLALAGKDKTSFYIKTEMGGTPTRFFPVTPFSREIIPYYTQIEAAAGLGGTLRLGFNPGELVDFIFGWTTLDIFGDDIE